MFEQSLLPSTHTQKPWTFAGAFLFQCLLVGMAVLIPMLIVEPLPMQNLTSVLVAPPPPPPPPPPPAPRVQRVAKTPPRQIVAGKLIAPVFIPPHPEIVKEPELPPPPSNFVVGGGVAGGVPGGVAGEQIGGLLAEMMKPESGALPPPAAPPPPPPPAPPERVRVGGDVENALLTHEVLPKYPPMARLARVQGKVRFEALIGTDGRIEHLQVLGGPPLLIHAAMEAVKQWMYKPTRLNGRPVEVETRITVDFALS